MWGRPGGGAPPARGGRGGGGGGGGGRPTRRRGGGAGAGGGGGRGRGATRGALGEVVAARYGKSERRAWELLRPPGDAEPVRLPLSLDVLLDAGWEPEGPCAPTFELDDVVIAAIRGLELVGWWPDDAAKI